MRSPLESRKLQMWATITPSDLGAMDGFRLHIHTGRPVGASLRKFSIELEIVIISVTLTGSQECK